jgi:hypothetical protein
VDAEVSLTAAQLEVERIQLGEAADETWSLSSAGSWPSCCEGEDIDEAPERSDTRSDAVSKLMEAAKQQSKEARELKAAKVARREAVAKLHLPTEKQPSWSTIDWEAPKFGEAERKTQEKRKKSIDNSADAPTTPKPRKGRQGWRHNSRQGLIGAVRYWADGSRANVVSMLLGLIHEFDVADAIRCKLFQKARRQAETDRIIVDRLVEALEVLKGCQIEQQRKDYLLALSLVAPPRAKERNGKGWGRRIAARLHVSRGKRSTRRGERPYAFETAMVQREEFDKAKARYSLPVGPLLNGQQRALVPDALQVGEKVLTHNGPAELTRFTADGGCVVTYRVGDVYGERTYKECYSKVAGSARLRRIPPSITSQPRQSRITSVSYATRKEILDHFTVFCPTSPHQRDVMRRRLGPFVHEERPASIMSDTLEGVFADYQQTNPDSTIKLSQYKLELPWYHKKAYRSTCLDRVDVNFDWHRQGLKVVIDLLAPLHAPPSHDAEGEAEAEAPPPDSLLVQLAAFAELTSRSKLGDALVCSQCLGDATDSNCIDGACEMGCGFKRWWSKGLRPKVLQLNVDGTESVRNGASALWEQPMMWDMVKPGSDGSNGSSAEESDLRALVSGTVTEFLDACEEVHRGWVPHRYHAVQAKVS